MAGVKQTKDGIEIKMHSQTEAIKSLADYLGMSNKSSGEVKVAAALVIGSAQDLTDDQLAAIAAGATMGVLPGVQSPAMLSANTIEGTYSPVSVPE
jgi:hypothetical protein